MTGRAWVLNLQTGKLNRPTPTKSIDQGQITKIKSQSTNLRFRVGHLNLIPDNYVRSRLRDKF